MKERRGRKGRKEGREEGRREGRRELCPMCMHAHLQLLS
jgi:predicted transposase YdaD